jgi:hypothetical protein
MAANPASNINSRKPLSEKPKLEVVPEEVLDEDEAEFRKLRRDIPGVKGASAIGIVAISVSRTPGKKRTRILSRGCRWSTSRSAWRNNSLPSTTIWL